MSDVLSQLLEQIWHVSLDLAPWLLVGTILSSLLHVMISPEFLRKHLGGRYGVTKAVLFGVPLPLCSCGVIPTALGLERDGASKGATVGFLITTPQTGADSVMVGASFLGWPFALFKVVAATITGLVGGYLVDRFDSPAQAAPVTRTEDRPHRHLPWWKNMVSHAEELLRSIWVWIVLGILASAAISVLLPPDLIAHTAGHNPLVSSLVALAISVPMYICATASVPVAAALASHGLPLGAVLVFLMGGPATNVATIGAVYRQFGAKTLTIYLATIIVGSMAFGLLFDSVVASTSPKEISHLHHGADNLFHSGSAVLMYVLFTYFGISGLAKRWQQHSPEQAHGSCCHSEDHKSEGTVHQHAQDTHCH